MCEGAQIGVLKTVQSYSDLIGSFINTTDKKHACHATDYLSDWLRPVPLAFLISLLLTFLADWVWRLSG